MIERNERGGGMSLMAIGAVLLAILIAGLVVDSGRQYEAAATAQAAAAAAARAASNSTATQRLAAAPIDGDAAITAAQQYLNQAGVSGSASINGQQITVEAIDTRPTQFLAVLGISQVSGRGHATANLVTP